MRGHAAAEIWLAFLLPMGPPVLLPPDGSPSKMGSQYVAGFSCNNYKYMYNAGDPAAIVGPPVLLLTDDSAFA